MAIPAFASVVLVVGDRMEATVEIIKEAQMSDDIKKRRIMTSREQFEKWWESLGTPQVFVLGIKPAIENIWQAANRAGQEAMREKCLALYEKAFEQNWVVQDTIDAIRNLPLDD